MNEYNKKIKNLSLIFKKYKIYSQGSYENSYLSYFCESYRENYYAKDISEFLRYHNYTQERIGADLPYWGSKYFTSEEGVRVFIVAQDSNSEDAGSVTFYANLMGIMDITQYKKYISNFQRFSGWGMVKDLINECGIDLDYVYITDARKVYPPESIRYKVNEFDNSETKELKKKYRRKLLMNKKNDDVNKALLYEEIKFCVPDIIIVLGTSGLSLVDNTLKLTEILGGDSLVYKNDKKYFLCPFPSRASTIYEKYKVKCAKNVREEIDILKKSLIESSM